MTSHRSKPHLRKLFAIFSDLLFLSKRLYKDIIMIDCYWLHRKQSKCYLVEKKRMKNLRCSVSGQYFNNIYYKRYDYLAKLSCKIRRNLIQSTYLPTYFLLLSLCFIALHRTFYTSSDFEWNVRTLGRVPNLSTFLNISQIRTGI